MKLGYSHTYLQLEKLQKLKLDGVGIYTKCLYHELNKQYSNIIPFNFNSHKMFFKKNTKEQPLAIASALLPPFISLHKDLETQIDVFHSTDYLIPRLKNTPVVATLHDAVMLKTPELATSGMRWLKNPLLKRSASWADHVITISQTMVPDIVEYWNIKPENISVVHNGIDTIWHQQISKEEIQRILNKYSITKPFILNVGTVQPRKNISRLIQAYKHLPDAIKSEYQLIVVGREGCVCSDTLLELNNLVNNKEGQWLKYVELQDLIALYQAATLFAFPSLSEGFGLPILEAFASKTAVLSSNTTSIPEVAGDAALLVNPEDTDAIEHGLQLLLENEALRRNFEQKGLARVKQFSWERCAKETYNILSQFI